MKTPKIVLALALMVGSGPVAAAQKPSPGDARKIESCLNRTESGGSHACVGLVAEPCLKAAETAPAGKSCAARELAVWSALLEESLKRVRRGGFQQIQSAVADAQKSWLASRERLCAVFDIVDPGMAPGGADYCRAEVTAERVLILRRLGDAINEH